jgi:hypothetical protein
MRFFLSGNCIILCSITTKTPTMVTEQQYKDAAKKLGIETAAIKAVAEIEAPRGGFDAQGRLTILFEPHIFWKQLRLRNIDPAKLQAKNPDLLSPVWNPKLYGKFSIQWDKMARAKAINEEAALYSASYGAFQIMGFNHKTCGFDTVRGFVEDLSMGEVNQLNAFCTYIKSVMLDDELRHKDWKGFARAYNGPAYWKNQYDTKLQKAYQKYAAQ